MNFCYRKIKFAKPANLDFLFGYSYYYNGDQKASIIKEVRISGIQMIYQCFFKEPGSYFFLPPEDIKNNRLVIISDKRLENDIIADSFYDRFGVDFHDVLIPMMQRALYFAKLWIVDSETDTNWDNRKMVFEKIPLEFQDRYYSKDDICLADIYSPSICNKELFLDCKFRTDFEPILIMPKTKKEVEYGLENIYSMDTQKLRDSMELPKSVQDIVDKYKENEAKQLEFDFDN